MRSTSRISGVGRRVIQGLGPRGPHDWWLTSPAGKVERRALPGSGEVLLHVAVVPCGVNRVTLPLMAVELKEMVAAVPRVLEAVQRNSRTFRSVVVLISASTSVRCEGPQDNDRSEEHTSELQSRLHLVCRLLLEKKKKRPQIYTPAFKT